MAPSKVLVVEDDKNLLDVVCYNLTKEGYEVSVARDGLEAVTVARRERPDLLVLDVMLPGLDGFEVCRLLRREMIVPILMLTAKTEEIDKVLGLELGADDYMTKPFSMRELLARLRAMLRRSQMLSDAVLNDGRQRLRVGDIEVDLDRHRATCRGVAIELSPKEYDLLVYLMRNRGRVFSREQLLDKVWGYDFAGDTRTVDVHVRWLRQKIEADPGNARLLLTVRGVGYKFEEDDAAQA